MHRRPPLQIDMSLLALRTCQRLWGTAVLVDSSTTPPTNHTIHSNFLTNSMLCSAAAGEALAGCSGLQGVARCRPGGARCSTASCSPRSSPGVCAAATWPHPNGGPCWGDAGAPFIERGASAAQDIVYGMGSFGPTYCGRGTCEWRRARCRCRGRQAPLLHLPLALPLHGPRDTQM